MSLKRGKFILFEGVGGCGKGTQVEKARELLTKNGLNVISTREPGGIESSESIRELIFLLKKERLIGSEGQLALFFAARKLWVDNLVKPKLEKGFNVLADRCYTSTGAYQGYAEGGNMNQILGIADVVMKDCKPDAVILLDISHNTSIMRRSDPNGDPFDEEDIGYFKKVIRGYRKMAKDRWGELNWYIIDGEPDPKEVAESVKKVLEKIFEMKLE